MALIFHRRIGSRAASIACFCVLAGASSLPAQVLVPRPQSSPIPVQPKIELHPAVQPDTAILPTGLPLRVQLDHRCRMRAEAPILGRIIEPVYSGDHIVIPENTTIRGHIAALHPVSKEERTWALLDGDVTPLKQPVLTFDTLLLDGRTLSLQAGATERTAKLVRMSRGERQSLWQEAKSQVHTKIESVDDVVRSPHKADLALKFFYGQLPYHPQEIWAGTQFDAVLEKPIVVPDTKATLQLPIVPPQGHIPPGTLHVRLLNTISSAKDHTGDHVAAVLTQPYFNAERTSVILPTGTRLNGVVTQVKPARSFDRNGTLRFDFRNIALPNGTLEHMDGQMTAVEGTQGQHVSVDSEGGAKANSPQGKFVAPLLLGALASHSFDADQGAAEAGVYSNGFGIVARIVGFAAATPAVSAGFAIYSAGKSVTRRWLMPGKNVVFAKNTRMDLSVADR